ncbi:MAG: recombinase family protein [Acidobacteriota bacterium]
MNDKITEAHLSRAAYVYVRQSTQLQVQNNLESKRRQYGLAGRAKELGWLQVEVIDDDLGCSGSGAVARKGFERLVAAVCLGEVGAVLSLEASRLARNNRDWHQLVDLCGLTGTLIIDQDGVYEPRQLNDRLLLGLKGTMSEFELGLFRQRSLEALRQKARRGELYMMVPVGYVKTQDGRCEKDPDLRIQQAVRTVYEKFEQMGSVRQVLLRCRQEGFLLPCVEYGPEGRRIRWKLPVYNTIYKFLNNPIYAGAYAFGRTVTQTKVVEGRARKRDGVAVDREQWAVLIRDHLPGYITWERYERNLARIRENANMKGLMRVKGAARPGRGLLAGLLRCGHCGRKLHVQYLARRRAPRYGCKGADVNHGGQGCIAFGARPVDAAISEKILEIVRPAGVEAAIRAAEQMSAEHDQKRGAQELALEQARYEAERAFRQFDAVEPENRIVATELEGRWNAALERVKGLEHELSESPSPGEEVKARQRERLMALGQDLPTVWFDERTDMSLKKRIARALIVEIIVRKPKDSDFLEMTVHWAGGRHSEVKARRLRSGQHGCSTDKDTVQLVRELAEVMPDKDIVRMLNRLGRKTGRGNAWIESRVAALRYHNGIAAYDPKKRKGLLTMHQAAERLGVSPMSVKRLIGQGILPARQIMPYAPRLIAEKDLGLPAVERAVLGIKRRGKMPLPENPDQKSLIFK